MDIKQIKNSKKQGGFTLVELAIVMIIIGLLIGGALKGQELIANAQIGATVRQVKSYEAAVSTFRDIYNALPGDMLVAGGSPADRIPNCGAVCDQNGNANQRIGGEPGAAYGSLTNENGAAWAQLVAADLISGVQQSTTVGTVPAAGVGIPAASIAGASWQIGYSANGALLSDTAAAAANARSGHYLLLDNSLASAASVATAALTPSQAARIDLKIDDGSPNTGSARAMGGAASATTCASTTVSTGVYNEALGGYLCGLYIRVQQ